jgi:hypothetical protein
MHTVTQARVVSDDGAWPWGADLFWDAILFRACGVLAIGLFELFLLAAFSAWAAAPALACVLFVAGGAGAGAVPVRRLLTALGRGRGGGSFLPAFVYGGSDCRAAAPWRGLRVGAWRGLLGGGGSDVAVPVPPSFAVDVGVLTVRRGKEFLVRGCRGLVCHRAFLAAVSEEDVLGW